MVNGEHRKIQSEEEDAEKERRGRGVREAEQMYNHGTICPTGAEGEAMGRNSIARSRLRPRFIIGRVSATAVAAVSCYSLVEQVFAEEVDEENGYCKGDNADMSCCEHGSGLLLPIVPYEHVWNRGVRAFLYLVALLWCFLGVSVLSDVFMAGIEAITNSTRIKKVPRVDKDGRQVLGDNGEPLHDEVEVNIWNPAVANLTLMALGSSTPEILLSIIEICGQGFFAGELGPGTVVGSAAFNLYVITGLCMLALPPGEMRRVEGFTVYLITAFHSLFAYLWMAIVLIWITPDVVDFGEAVITFLLMPWLVSWVYSADRNWFRGAQVHPDDSDEPRRTSLPAAENANGDGNGEVKATAGELPDIERPPSDQQQQQGFTRVTSSGSGQQHSYLHYRRIAANVTSGALNKNRRMSAGKEEDLKAQIQADQEQEANRLNAFKSAIQESFHVTSHAVFHWEAAAYAFAETNGEAKICILRSGKTDSPGRVAYRTLEGSAKEGAAFEARTGQVMFEANETQKAVFIPLIHDYQWNPNLDFFVMLEPVDVTEGTVDPRSCKTKVTVIDTDKAGTFAFSKANIQTYLSSDSHAFLLIERRQGLEKVCYSKITTRDQSALQMIHYHPVDGLVLTWRPYEASKQVKIRLCPFDEPANDNPDDKSVRFLVDVVEVDEGGGVVDGQEAHTADVKVVFNPNKTLDLDGDEDIPTWSEQFRQAINVNAGGDLGDASVVDCVMHWLSIGWKLMAAIVPPPNIWGGWACFSVALALIGLVTAIIGDLASIFGCLVGLKDTVTAFTVVALGTSLPDTFASVLAIRADDTADNAIGNVTGSNSVNVFLGLGFPWIMATVYWWAVGPSDAWVEKYGPVFEGGPPKWEHYDKYKESGAFVVLGGSLGFNTMIFSILTFFAFLFLYWRRVHYGGEIGGPNMLNRLSALFMVSLWFIYVMVSALQAYHPDNFVSF